MKRVAILMLAGIVPATSSAQAQVMAQPVAQPQPGSAVLPANTEVMVTLNNEVNSKHVKQGQQFDVSVSRDVMLGSYIVIPRGTHGRGEVVYRTGKGAFGKSAKMEIEVRNLDVDGRRVPVSGKFRQEGTGNTGATVAAAVAVGVFSAFVTGRSAVFEQGRELRTFTVEPLPVALPAAAVATSSTVPVAASVPVR